MYARITRLYVLTIASAATLARRSLVPTAFIERNGHLTRENREHKEKEHKEAGAKTQEEARPEKASVTVIRT